MFFVPCQQLHYSVRNRGLFRNTESEKRSWKQWNENITKKCVQGKRADALSLPSLILWLFLQAHCAALDQLRRRLEGVSLQYSTSEVIMNRLHFYITLCSPSLFAAVTLICGDGACQVSTLTPCYQHSETQCARNRQENRGTAGKEHNMLEPVLQPLIIFKCMLGVLCLYNLCICVLL